MSYGSVDSRVNCVSTSKNPATGAPLPGTPSHSDAEVAAFFAAARQAQPLWRQHSFKERAQCVRRVQAFLAANADRAADVVAAATGKTRMDAMATEVIPCTLACAWYADNAASVLRPQSLACGNILFANKSNTLQYSPLGVVGIISPWNYPLSIPFGEVVMGLMAGNAILLKCAAQTTTVGAFIAECIAAGGFPAGLFQHVVMSGSKVSKAFMQHDVDKLFFTGSVGVGKQLMREAADKLTPLSLELGGKDAMVVMDDANLERAVGCALWACFQNAGQSCGGVERVYVHKSRHAAFLEQVVAKTTALRHGPDTDYNVDIGSVTTQGQYDTIKGQVDEAVSQGAVIVAQSHPVGDCSKGLFYPATVLTNVNHKMRVMVEETFGPVMPIMAFGSDDEAVQLANDCTMALTASVFTGNSRGRKIAARLDAGVVTVNDHLYTHGVSEAPWGGWKDSGLGRTHGPLGLKEMSNAKCVNTDMLPASLIPNNMWWYPFSQQTYEGVRAAVHFSAPARWFGSLAPAAKLLPFAVGRMFCKWTPTPDAGPK
jgi:succinate-semialdehyde dehydrogenase/glutarate-semialdehyde dehydrogenase